MDEKIDCIIASRMEVEELLGWFLPKYPCDIEFVKYTYVLADIFKFPMTDGWRADRFGGMTGERKNGETNEQHSGEMTMKKYGEESDDAVKKLVSMIDFDESNVNLENNSEVRAFDDGQIQVMPTPLSQFWYNRTLHDACDETERRCMANKKAKMNEEEVKETVTVHVATDYETNDPNTALKATREQKGKQICIDSSVRKGRKGGLVNQTAANTGNVIGQ